MTDSPLIGQTIAGRFRITGFIGEGAMATVYRGLQEAEPRDVAVKIMHPHLARDATFSARFRREAKAAALLKHPNTVHIIDYGQDKDRLYIAMELIGGQDLFEMLVLERRFSEGRAARIVAQVCDALSTAHARGIIHRDLKPENVMVLPHPQDPNYDFIKVLDFGIAKIVEREKPPDSDEAPSSLVHSALTTVGVVVGTPAYMSPEQCRAEAVDARSDVYSCGILLYQLLCGRTPFTGDSPIEIAINQVRMQPDPPSSIVPNINPGLEKVILTALEKWPAQRQQSAAQLRDELVALLPQLTDDRKPLSSGKQPPPPEVHAEDRAPATPAAPDLSDMASTLRKGDDGSQQRPPMPYLQPPQNVAITAPAAGVGAQLGSSAPQLGSSAPQLGSSAPQLGSSAPHQGGSAPQPPTLAPRLPAAIAAQSMSGPPTPQSGAIPPAPPSSDPYSSPPSLDIFPRPIGPPLHQRQDPPPAAPPPVAMPVHPAVIAPVTRRPSQGMPSWLVLVLAIVVGVGVGVIAHFVAQLRR